MKTRCLIWGLGAALGWVGLAGCQPETQPAAGPPDAPPAAPRPGRRLFNPDARYNRKSTARLTGLRSAGGELYYPTVLVTVLYRTDPITRAVQDAKVYFRAEDTTHVLLTTSSFFLRKKFDGRIFRFDSQLQAERSLLGDSVAPYKAEMSFNPHLRGPRFVSHAAVAGMLDARDGTLEVWGHVL